MNVGFIGLGRMGRPMARALLAAGHRLTVQNRSSGPEAELERAGALVAASPAGVAAEVAILITMLSDGAAVADVVFGDDGVLSGARRNLVLVDMSTTGPAFARDLANRAVTHGVAVLDAPVSGGVALAESARLTTIVGGDHDVFDLARPVLAAMTREQIWLGETGAGAAMKLALNGILAITNQAIAEALVVAEVSGIDPARAYAAIEASAIRSPFVEYKRDAFLGPQNSAASFSLALMQKDVALYLELARSLGVPMSSASAADQALTLARKIRGDEADIADVAQALRELVVTSSRKAPA